MLVSGTPIDVVILTPEQIDLAQRLARAGGRSVAMLVAVLAGYDAHFDYLLCLIDGMVN
jgi:hypothetical protein